MDGVRKLNPTFRYILHNGYEYASDPFIKTAKERGVAPAFIVDRIRMLVLKEHGGVYVDSDCVAVKSFESIADILDSPRTDFVYAFRSPDRRGVNLHSGIALVDNTILASAKNGRMIGRLLELYQHGAPVQTGQTTGLHILRHVDGGSVGLNFRFWYSEQVYPETICLHDSTNLGSWCNTKAKQHV